MIVLGIESSCDETAACLMRWQEGSKPQILAEQVASQESVHAPHGGIVPELASRRHLVTLAAMVWQLLSEAGITVAGLAGIAATHQPGLLGSLLVGLSYAKALAWQTGKPFVGVSHLAAHLSAPYLEHTEIPYPHTALLVSGGHTAIYRRSAFDQIVLIGATRDDAAGEAFDKVAKCLSLSYPGGPVIEKMARSGNPKAIHFPRGEVKGRPHDFSFSGLKTAVRRYVETLGGSCHGGDLASTGRPRQKRGDRPQGTSVPPAIIAIHNVINHRTSEMLSDKAPDERGPRRTGTYVEGLARRATQDDGICDVLYNVCASFQEAVVDTLVKKTVAVAREHGDPAILLTGGVACNQRLRECLKNAAEKIGAQTFVSSPRYCTDNAAMVAYLGACKLARGECSRWDLNAIATEISKGPVHPL